MLDSTKLEQLALGLEAALRRRDQGPGRWPEATFDLATDMVRARDQFDNDRDFGKWMDARFGQTPIPKNERSLLMRWGRKALGLPELPFDYGPAEPLQRREKQEQRERDQREREAKQAREREQREQRQREEEEARARRMADALAREQAKFKVAEDQYNEAKRGPGFDPLDYVRSMLKPNNGFALTVDEFRTIVRAAHPDNSASEGIRTEALSILNSRKEALTGVK
jgi:hypothetical protein